MKMIAGAIVILAGAVAYAAGVLKGGDADRFLLLAPESTGEAMRGHSTT